MLPIRKTLLEQIQLTIDKKLPERLNITNAQKNKQWISELFEANGRNEKPRRENKSFKKLERRLNHLEKQNDQLTSFIDFIIDNLPELITRIINNTNHPLLNSKLKIRQNASQPNGLPQMHCCKKINYPNPTPREAEVLDLLIKGLCAKEIANRLFISETTVITHKKNLKEKYNARNTVELISKAYKSLTKNEGDF